MMKTTIKFFAALFIVSILFGCQSEAINPVAPQGIHVNVTPTENFENGSVQEPENTQHAENAIM